MCVKGADVVKRIGVFMIILFSVVNIVSADADRIWTRGYLNDQGIDDDRMTFEKGTIYLDGNEFYSVSVIVDGRSYAMKSAFEEATTAYLKGSLVVTSEGEDGTIRKMSSSYYDQSNPDSEAQ